MDKTLEAKKKMQKEACLAAQAAGFILSMIITVGGGKGKILLTCAKYLVKKYNLKKIIYVCDNKGLRDSIENGFPAEIEKWSPELKELIQLECYQTVYKWKNTEWDILLADEVDFALTPSYVKFFRNNNFRFKICVSGTLASNKKLLLETIAPIKFICDTTDAENAGIINKTNYFVYNYGMTEQESERYRKLTKKISLVMAQYPENEEEKERIEKQRDFWIRKRKRFLASLQSSQKHVKKVINYIEKTSKEPRIVIFTELRTQADAVCEHSFHGENEKEDNLGKFQRGEINKVSVVSKITRGINLKRALYGIYESTSGSNVAFGQRSGRLKRLKVDEFATIIFLLPWFRLKDKKEFKPTIVEKWIDKATSNLRNIQIKDLKL